MKISFLNLVPFLFLGDIYILVFRGGGTLCWNFVRHLLGSLSTVKRKTPLEGNPNLQVRGLSHQKERKNMKKESESITSGS